MRDRPKFGTPLDGESERSTLRNRIYSELKTSLISGKFEPGEGITAKAASEAIGAGLMPVREALQRLIAEGALEGLPNGRARIPVMSRLSFEKLMNIRLLLEPYACFEAAGLADDAERRIINETFRRLSKAFGDRNKPEELLWANFNCHFAIYRAAHSSHLVFLIESLWLRFGPLLNFIARRADLRGHLLTRYERPMHRQLNAAVLEHKSEDAARLCAEILNASKMWFEEHYPFAD
jgi:DNA-binding GntR family transcriptional regulator